MLYKNSHEISGIFNGNKIIIAVFKGASLVWQSIRSCFGAGYWINRFPWIDTDTWKN